MVFALRPFAPMEPADFGKWWNNLNGLDVALSFIINMIAALSAFLLGVFFRVIPHSWRSFRARQFWGVGDILVCHGTLQLNRAVFQVSPFVKIFRDGTAVRLNGPSENVMGDSEIRSSNYLVGALSRCGRCVSAEPDNKGLAQLDRTIVALGSPSSNEVTRLVLSEPLNRFLEFGQDGAFICDMETGARFSGFRPPIRKDYGMILRIPNDRFPGRFFFVCAGLGDWGTSGASWFLSSNWNYLRSMYPGGFGVVVEVDIGSDQSARLVTPESLDDAHGRLFGGASLPGDPPPPSATGTVWPPDAR